MRTALARPVIFVLAMAAVPAAAFADCPRPPPVIRDLSVARFYADKDGSIVDQEFEKQHAVDVAPLNAFLRHVVTDADRSLRQRSSPIPAAQCALTWIAAWAKDDALLGTMGSMQAEHERKWALAGVALAYLKLKPFATPDQSRAIEPWLIRVADAACAFFDDPNRKRNNHWYWLGLGIGATALAANSETHWDVARRIMQDAARDIGRDGSLPLELARKARALHYHVFAAMPLVVLAELAHRRGEDWYAFGDHAVDRLIDLTVRGLADPAIFDRLAGVPQERSANGGAGWLPLYRGTHPRIINTIDPPMPTGHRWLGGDVLLLMQALDAQH